MLLTYSITLDALNYMENITDWHDSMNRQNQIKKLSLSALHKQEGKAPVHFHVS